MPDRETELVIEDDTGNRRRLPLPSGEITVGRDPANVVCLPERNVSRRHALLAHEGEGFVAEDLGSSNGVFLNGVRLEGRRPFAAGDRLRIGDFELWLRAAGRATDMTLPDAGAKTARARRGDATDRRDTAPAIAPSVVVRRGASWPWLVAVLFGLALGVLLGVWGQRSLTPPPPVLSSDTVAPLVPLVPAEVAGEQLAAPAPAPALAPAVAPAPPPAAPRVPPPPAAVRASPAPAVTPAEPAPPAPPLEGAAAAYAEAVAALKAGGDLAPALAALERCLALEPGRGPCWRALGIAKARAGDHAAAAAAYRRYLELEPSAADAERVRELLEQYESP